MNIIEWLEANDYEPSDLDEIVHAAASEMASNANNAGIEGQVDFLRTVCGWDDKEIQNSLNVYFGESPA